MITKRRGVLSFIACTLLACGIPVAPVVAMSVPTTNLVGEWLFSGDALDTSGSGNDGAIIGATFGTDRFGIVGSALSLNAVQQRVSVPHSASLTFSGDLTVSAWIRTTDSFGGIASQHNGGGDGNFVLGIGTGGKLRFGRSASVLGGAFDSVVVNNNTWRHVVGVFDDANDEVRHYVDGELEFTGAELASLPLGALSLTIGEEGNLAYSFGGLIDDVRIYDRALTSEEIMDLHQEVLVPIPAAAWLFISAFAVLVPPAVRRRPRPTL